MRKKLIFFLVKTGNLIQWPACTDVYDELRQITLSEYLVSPIAVSLEIFLTWLSLFDLISIQYLFSQIENNSQFDYWWVYLNPFDKKREQSKMLKSPVVQV